MQLFQNFSQQNAPSNHVDAATKNVAKYEPLYASAKMKTSDYYTPEPKENLGKFLQDSVENPIKVLKSNPSNNTSIQKDTIFVADADAKKAKECSEENVIKKPTDKVRAIDENASNRVKELKTTKPDESKAALKKPDAREDKEVNDVEAILLSPFYLASRRNPLTMKNMSRTVQKSQFLRLKSKNFILVALVSSFVSLFYSYKAANLQASSASPATFP